jgi:hypothetical protein
MNNIEQSKPYQQKSRKRLLCRRKKSYDSLSTQRLFYQIKNSLDLILAESKSSTSNYTSSHEPSIIYIITSLLISACRHSSMSSPRSVRSIASSVFFLAIMCRNNRTSIVLVNSLDRSSIVIFALELVVDDCSNPGNSIDKNGPVHVHWDGVWKGRRATPSRKTKR